MGRAWRWIRITGITFVRRWRFSSRFRGLTMGNAAAVAVAAAAAVMVGFARGERWEREVDGDTIDTRMVVEEEEG
jgi:hypothetical protein